ncbi:MAG: hypothetical protein AAGB10_23405, partial [Pseudomonadota bacterium]
MDQVKKLNATQEAAHDFLSLKRGTPQHTLWAAAQKGGSAIDEYREFQIRVAREFSDLSKYVKEKGEDAFEPRIDGQDNQILVVNPPTGSTTLVVRSQGFEQSQHDAASGVTYNGVGEIVVDPSSDELSTVISFEVTDSVIMATGGLLRLYIDAILAAVRAVYQFLVKSVAPADVIELSDLS